MARYKKGVKYCTISIPEGLALRIDERIAESKGDYTSRSDLIKHAVRRLLEDDF